MNDFGLWWALPGWVALAVVLAPAITRWLHRRSDYDRRYREYLAALARNESPRSLP